MITLFSQHRRAPWLLGVGAAATVLAVGWVLGSHFTLGAVAVSAALVGFLVFIKPEVAFIASLLSIVVGQVIRLPIAGNEASILPNDLIIPAFIVAWVLQRLASRHWSIPRHSLTLPIIAVLLTMMLSLLVNYRFYQGREFLAGGLYALRWIEYLALFWAGLDIFSHPRIAGRYLGGFVLIGVVLAMLGFLQLRLFPDFSFMVPQGWDPHVGRLLSTWYDPNFLGGLFAFLVAISLSLALAAPWREARWWWMATVVIVLATILTFSRSGYIGLVLAVGFVTLVRSRFWLVIGTLAMIGMVLFVPRIQERVIGIRSLDETAQLRLVSYRNAGEVIRDRPWLGVGYNLYKYVQVDRGFLKDTKEHSASGSDSSLLTIWVTTGTLGLLAFLWLFGAMLREAWRTWHDHRLPAQWQAFGLGLFAALLGLFAHSQFVNGLFYPHLMEMVWLTVAMAIAVRPPEAA